MDGDVEKWIECVFVRAVGVDAGRSSVIENIFGSVAGVQNYASGVVSWTVTGDTDRVKGACCEKGES